VFRLDAGRHGQVERSKKTNEDTLQSERRSVLKKSLPEPTLLEMSGNPTSMISLCQEGKSSPDALGRSALIRILQASSARVRASRRWFLFGPEPDIHLLSQANEWSSQKIAFVLSCQSRNKSK
jgi:hypothetical protein